jgi:hypothetical protein
MASCILLKSVVQLKILEQDKINNTQPRNTCFAYFTTEFRLRGLAGIGSELLASYSVF